MPSRPWFPFNPSDYLADTRLLSLEAHGLYFLLLQHHWMMERLPSDLDTLAKLTGQDRRKFRRVFKEVCEFFDDANGYFVNKRMVAEIAKAKEKTAKAKDSAAARWNADDANALRSHDGDQCERNANQNQQPELNTTYVRTSMDFDFDESIARSIARQVSEKLKLAPTNSKGREACWRAGYVVATGKVHQGAIDGALRAVAEERPTNPFKFLFGCIRKRADLNREDFDRLWNQAPNAPPPETKATNTEQATG